MGHFGCLHALKLSKLPSAHLQGLFDLDPKTTERVAASCRCAAFESFDALIEVCEAIVVATPAVTHAALVERALLRGCAVFVEKPLATTRAEAERLCALASNRCVQVGHIERFHPSLQALRSLPARGEALFERAILRSERNRDVGAILDLMIHDLDLALWLWGPEAELLSAKRFADGPNACEDAAEVVLQLGEIKAIFRCDRAGEVRKRRICLGGQAIDLSQTDGDPLKSELEAFVACCRSQKTPPVTVDEGALALDWALRAMSMAPILPR